MEDIIELEQIKRILSDKFKLAISKISKEDSKKIQEIRLRLGKYLSVCVLDKEYYVTEAGKLTQFPQLAIKVDKNDIETTFKIVCQYSLHSFQKELSQGFVTVQGGNRIGLCGTAVLKNEMVETIKDISSINIRVARQIIGCANELYANLFSSGLQSVLIVGEPSSGKTTILRDLCRQLGQVFKVSIIDERNEISATVNGVPQNNIGTFSDVFNAYPKSEGIMTAIRVMSPQIVVCDEIGSDLDVKALGNAVHCGARIMATAHAGTISEAKNRIGLSKLIKMGAFNSIVLLGKGEKLGEIIKIDRIGDKND